LLRIRRTPPAGFDLRSIKTRQVNPAGRHARQRPLAVEQAGTTGKREQPDHHRQAGN